MRLRKRITQSVSDAVVNEVMAQHTLRFSAALVSTTLTVNDRAGILIRQDGRLVQPVGNDVKHDERSGVVRQTLTSEFDSKTLNVKKPITVIVLNVELPAVGTAPPVTKSVTRSIRRSFDSRRRLARLNAGASMRVHGAEPYRVERPAAQIVNAR